MNPDISACVSFHESALLSDEYLVGKKLRPLSENVWPSLSSSTLRKTTAHPCLKHNCKLKINLCSRINWKKFGKIAIKRTLNLCLIKVGIVGLTLMIKVQWPTYIVEKTVRKNGRFRWIGCCLYLLKRTSKAQSRCTLASAEVYAYRKGGGSKFYFHWYGWVVWRVKAQAQLLMKCKFKISSSSSLMVGSETLQRPLRVTLQDGKKVF